MGLLTGIGSQGGRLAGTVGDANELAVALVAALALVPPMLARARSSRARFVMIAAGGAVTLLGLVMTGSRGGSISLMAAALVAMMLGRHWWRWAVPVLVVGAAGVLILASGAQIPGPASHLNDSNTSNRTTLWTIAVRMADAHPMTGVGVGNFVTESPRYLVQPGSVTRSDLVISQRKVAHNTYLQLAAEGGAPALLLFVAILALAGACGVRAARRFARAGEHDMAFLAQAFVIGLAGISVGAVFLSLEVNKQLWLVAAACVGLYRISAAPRTGPRLRGPSGRSERRPAGGGDDVIRGNHAATWHQRPGLSSLLHLLGPAFAAAAVTATTHNPAEYAWVFVVTALICWAARLDNYPIHLMSTARFAVRVGSAMAAAAVAVAPAYLEAVSLAPGPSSRSSQPGPRLP